MKSRLLSTFAIAVMTATTAMADEFVVDGLKYSTSSYGEEVTVTGYTTPVANLEIPETVEYEGTSYTVTTVGESAFEGNEVLTTIKFPETLTFISQMAFFNCTGIEKLEMPESMYYISGYAFAGCTSLKEISIGENLGNIDDYAFRDCDALERVDITSLEAWLNISFANSDSNPLNKAHNLYIDGTLAENLEIPEMVWEIKENAFVGAKCLKSVVIGEDVETIGWYAFCDCSSLESVTLPENFSEGIETAVFYGCSSLKTMVLPEGVSYIDNYAFQDCTSLESITIPTGLRSIGQFAFRDCKSLKSITIPDDIYEIGVQAFLGCSSLKEVKLPSSIKEIPSGLFSDCTSIENIELPDGVTRVNDGVFSGCTSLKKVVVPPSVILFGAGAFANDDAIERVEIKDLKAWCEILFTDAMSNPLCGKGNIYLNGELIENIEFPEGIAVVGDYIFANAKCLKSAKFSTDVTTFSNGCLMNCTNLETMEIPYSVGEIGSFTFMGCTGIKNVKIGDLSSWFNINFASADANPLFESDEATLVFNDNAINNLEIPVSVNTIKQFAMIGAKTLTSVQFPTTVKTIGRMAFGACTGLTRIDLGKNVELIDEGAFAGCANVTTITLPANLSQINTSAFDYIYGLEYIIDHAKTPQILGTPDMNDKHVFADDNYTNTKVYIPSGSLEAYKAQNQWNKFQNFVEADVDNLIELSLKYDSELGEVKVNGQSGEYFILDNSVENIVEISPVKGYEIGSVKLNDMDMTREVVDNKLVLKDLSDTNVVLSVEFTKSDSIILISEDSDNRVAIYDLNGNRVFNGMLSDFNPAACGIYIVKTRKSETKKIVR